VSSPAFAQSTSAALHVELIQDSRRLTALRPEWFDLWSSLQQSTPFQSPDWLLPWWSHYGDGVLLAFTFRCGERLVGFAPLYIYQDASGQPRQVLFMGTGNSDYLDVIFHPEFESACSEHLFSELRGMSTVWDECDFQQLRLVSPLSRALKEVRSDVKADEHELCPVLDLTSPDASRAMAKRASYYQRRLQKEASFSIEKATTQSFDEIFDALERLHQDRWRGRGFSAALREERDRQFHRAAARALLDARMLRLYGARLGGRIAAALYAFCHRNRTYFYLAGFDSDYARFSIGAILLAHAIEQARAEGCDSFDFLRGREPYKYRWGACDQVTYRKRLVNKRQESHA
jgi:CelD/BcsL family acetyltransferase involved in cellulose biosynthesis